MIKNSKLSQLIALNHKITVYVPATKIENGIAKQIDNSSYVERMAILMSNTFGGATSSPAIGYWMSAERGLEKEKTTMVFSFAKSLEDVDFIIDECEKIKAELNQDSIALEADQVMHFV